MAWLENPTVTLVAGALLGLLVTQLNDYAKFRRDSAAAKRAAEASAAEADAQRRRGAVNRFVTEIESFWVSALRDHELLQRETLTAEEMSANGLAWEAAVAKAEVALFWLRLDCPELGDAGAALIAHGHDTDWAKGLNLFVDAARQVLGSAAVATR